MWVRFLFGEIIIVISRYGNETKRDVGFHQTTCNVSKIQFKMGKDMSLNLLHTGYIFNENVLIYKRKTKILYIFIYFSLQLYLVLHKYVLTVLFCMHWLNIFIKDNLVPRRGPRRI